MCKKYACSGALLFLLACISSPLYAQNERALVKQGNQAYKSDEYEKAALDYRKALDVKKESHYAGFNLGNAYYKQKKYEDAIRQFNTMIEKEQDKKRLGELYYNMGNTLLAMDKLDEGIEAYKESLRNRPDFENAKYNLEYARNKKKRQEENKDQQNKDQQNKNQQDKDQQNKDQQNKDQQDKDQQNKDQQDKDQQNKDQQNKDQQNKDQQDKDRQDKDRQSGPQPRISKEDAQRLLEALEQDEKRVQEKVSKEKMKAVKAQKSRIKKNW